MLGARTTDRQRQRSQRYGKGASRCLPASRAPFEKYPTPRGRSSRLRSVLSIVLFLRPEFLLPGDEAAVKVRPRSAKTHPARGSASHMVLLCQIVSKKCYAYRGPFTPQRALLRAPQTELPPAEAAFHLNRVTKEAQIIARYLRKNRFRAIEMSAHKYFCPGGTIVEISSCHVGEGRHLPGSFWCSSTKKVQKMLRRKKLGLGAFQSAKLHPRLAAEHKSQNVNKRSHNVFHAGMGGDSCAMLCLRWLR